MSDFILLCGFDLIFGNEEKLPKEKYIEGVEKKTLLKLASYLLGLDPSKSPLNEWKELISIWFRPANEEMATTVWNRCEDLQQQYKKITLLSTIASLKLFEFIFETPVQNAEVDEVTSEANLFRLYSIFVDEVTKNEEASRDYLKKKRPGIRVAATLLNQTFPYSDLQNYVLHEIFLCQITKAYYLFEFLQSNKKTAALEKAFCETFGIKTITEYFQHFSLIYKGHFERQAEGWLEFNVTKDEHFDKNCQFLDAISLVTFDAELDTDFKILRGNPIYKVGEGKYTVISPLFATEKIYKGAYFKLNEVNQSLPVENRVKNFRSFYASEFTENFLLYKILGYIYSSRNYIQLTGKKLAELGDGLPDYYIRNGNHLFLFENKDIFINADIKQSGNFEKLESEIKKKLYFEKKETKIYFKGVCQLICNVKRALLNQNEFDNTYKGKNINIYPILVLHDSSFNAPGLNSLINYWFQFQLKKISEEGINVSKVRPVAVINIDTLILYADYLKLKRMSLEDLLDAYKKYTILNDKKQYRDFDHLKAAYLDINYPFSLFIHNFTNNGNAKVPFKMMQLLLPEIFKSDTSEV